MAYHEASLVAEFALGDARRARVNTPRKVRSVKTGDKYQRAALKAELIRLRGLPLLDEQWAKNNWGGQMNAEEYKKQAAEQAAVDVRAAELLAKIEAMKG